MAKQTKTAAALAAGEAWGGFAAAIASFSLWVKCAIGNSGVDVTPLLETALAAIRGEGFDRRQKAGRLEAIMAAASKVAAAVNEAEGEIAPQIFIDIPNATLRWDGSWTACRAIWLKFGLDDDFCNPVTTTVCLKWQTGTGKESQYLGLPSMTDEADLMPNDRPGGWGGGGWEGRRPIGV